MIRIGLDPGLKGAIAAIYDGGVIVLHKLPVHKVYKKEEVDPLAFYGLLRSMLDGDDVDVFAVLETTQAMPKFHGAKRVDTPTTAMSLGIGWGVCYAVFAVLMVPRERVSPAKWKKAMGLDADKKKSIAKAKELFPSVNLVPSGCRVESDGFAEALLLAEYGRRIHG